MRGRFFVGKNDRRNFNIGKRMPIALINLIKRLIDDIYQIELANIKILLTE
jgi:hypothetical protein